MQVIILAIIAALGTIAIIPCLAMISGTIMYFLWNYMAPIYFTFLQPQYLHIPWWHCVCLLWIIQILNPFRNISTSTSK
jgi:hypothetical protein